MNGFAYRLNRVKKNWPSLLFLTVWQTALNFTFPALERLGGLWYFAVGSLLSIWCIIVFVHLAMYPEKLRPLLTFEFFDNFPDAIFVKRLFVAFMVAINLACYFTFWYIDYYAMPSIWYLIWGLHGLITFMIMDEIIRKDD